MNPLDETEDPLEVIERQRKLISALTDLVCDLGFEPEELLDATA